MITLFPSYISTMAGRVPTSSNQLEHPSSPEKVDQHCAVNQSPTRPHQLSTPERVGHRSDPNHSPTKPRRFPRPLSTAIPSFSQIDSRVSHHIASTTAPRTPPATKNNSFPLTSSPGSAPADVITSPDNATLAKAYGSILQRPDTLPIHTCARCSAIFPPDATIYPDPQVPCGTAPQFLCRPCFAAHGGSKGDCAECGREVLTATKEGGFIESTGSVWHKRCFLCNGCHKSIGHAPLVDLYGKPSCSECFDSCLDRKGTPKKKPLASTNNIGGMRERSRESSPALEELSERLGIRRQASSQQNRSPSRETSNPPSPRRVFSVNREESLQLHSSFGSTLPGSLFRQTKIPEPSGKSSQPLYPRTNEAATPNEPMTPDLSSSSSASDSLSSWAPSTPSNSPRQSLTPKSRDSITPKAKGALMPSKVLTTGENQCGRCFQSLFSISGNGRMVTVPAESAGGFPTSFHASCFRCFVCGDVFEGKEHGHATFVKDSRGVCHPEVCFFQITAYIIF